ncbi:MAG TPA: carbohydrate kinase [Oleiagrimonas sp.]|nr:carbohydrate kinase [Oleiagrimonas sp.]
MGKLVCFGEILIDLFAQAPSTPEAPRAFLQHAGGAPANVAVAAARLGADAHFVGMLGHDMFGDFLADSLEKAGVGITGVARTREAKTALAFVALDAHGERSFSFYRPPAADLLFRAEDFRDDTFEGLGAFHVCSNSLTEPDIAATTCEGMRRARAAGALVSMDMNLREVLWADGADPVPRLWQALALAELVKLSREELEFLARPLGADGETQVIRRLLDANTRCVVVTDGHHPLQWHTAKAHGQVQGFQVKAVDTTGAGDAFMGGLLSALIAHGADGSEFAAFCDKPQALEQVLRFGAAVGALAVTRKGAFAAMPARDDVHRLLQQHPHTPEVSA